MDSVKDRLNELAHDFFGISYIYPYQRLVISNIFSAAEKTGEIIDIINPGYVTSFTATAKSSIFSEIRNRIFRKNRVNIIAESPDKSNIFYSVVPTICMDRNTSVYTENDKKQWEYSAQSRTDKNAQSFISFIYQAAH